ncbi:MAG: hypothetical protein WCE61_11935 [Candidatus Acidiferrum sp.]
MKPFSSSLRFCAVPMVLLMLAGAPVLMAQVSPAEVRNPQLKALESEYFQKLIALNRQISAEKYPFPFVLSRYIGVDPKKQAGMDTRGIEFVQFHDRILLKFSGNYNAAFNAQQLTQNQRADLVFTDVIAPILRLLPQYFAESSDFEGYGFEISYHVSDAGGKADYEGRENLVVVMGVSDAMRFSKLKAPDEKQNILNASEIYVSGERFGLALGQADPLPAEEITKRGGADAQERASSDTGGRTLSTSSSVAGLDFHASHEPTAPPPLPALIEHPPSMTDAPPMSPADVDAFQAKYQSALDDYGTFVGTTMHTTSSSLPSLALFRNSLYLQLTLRNPEVFDKEKTSLYKRAALSFDTFLAPHLADLVSRIPAISNLKGLDITILVSVSSSSSPSEAVEFIFPLAAMHSFASYEITNQQLIEQGLVIVNGVRISLNLQQVE